MEILFCIFDTFPSIFFVESGGKIIYLKFIDKEIENMNNMWVVI